MHQNFSEQKAPGKYHKIYEVVFLDCLVAGAGFAEKHTIKMLI